MRGDVHQHRADVNPGDQGPLHGRPQRHREVWLDLGVDRPAKAFVEQAMHHRRAHRAPDEQDLVDLRGLEFRVGQRTVDARRVRASKGSIRSS